jgi:hypothetical protein
MQDILDNDFVGKIAADLGIDISSKEVEDLVKDVKKGDEEKKKEEEDKK